MIDFRYHVVSIVAVFLALALGLFLGSTTLQGTVADQLTTRQNKLQAQNDQLKNQILPQETNQIHGLQGFIQALAPYALAGRLAGQTVAVVSAPGVSGGVRQTVETLLATAGATVSADVRLDSAFSDPQQQEFLTALTSHIDLPDRAAPTGTGVARAAALLADVLGQRPDTTAVPASASEQLLATYADGKLLNVASPTVRPGSLALLLVPSADTRASADAAEAANAGLLDLARDLDEAALGAVIAGPAGAAAGTGMLALARSDNVLRQSVSTVDGIEQPAGVIATVLALAAEVRGHSGAYGVSSGDTPVPSVSPSP